MSSVIDELSEEKQFPSWEGVFLAKIIEAVRKYAKNGKAYVRLNIELRRKKFTKKVYWFIFSRNQFKNLLDELNIAPEKASVNISGRIEKLEGRYLQVEIALVEGNDGKVRERVINFSLLPEEEKLLEAQELFGGEIKDEELPF